MGDDIAPPRIGDTFILSDQDYRYGSGPVVAIVKTIVALVKYDDEPWWQVEVEAAMGTPDCHGGWYCRQMYIRESAFPHTRQRLQR